MFLICSFGWWCWRRLECHRRCCAAGIDVVRCIFFSYHRSVEMENASFIWFIFKQYLKVFLMFWHISVCRCSMHIRHCLVVASRFSIRQRLPRPLTEICLLTGAPTREHSSRTSSTVLLAPAVADWLREYLGFFRVWVLQFSKSRILMGFDAPISKWKCVFCYRNVDLMGDLQRCK